MTVRGVIHTRNAVHFLTSKKFFVSTRNVTREEFSYLSTAQDRKYSNKGQDFGLGRNIVSGFLIIQ